MRSGSSSSSTAVSWVSGVSSVSASSERMAWPLASTLSMGAGAYLASKSEREVYESEVTREQTDAVRALPVAKVVDATGAGDLFAAGIIDPAKVTRSALENAASVAGLMLTTETVVTDLPEKDKAPAMPPGGMGMDY